MRGSISTTPLPACAAAGAGPSRSSMSDMPQIGQLPGSSLRTSGCIAQVQ